MNAIEDKEKTIQDYINKIERSRYNIIELSDRIDKLEESIYLYKSEIEEERLKVKAFEEYIKAIND